MGKVVFSLMLYVWSNGTSKWSGVPDGTRTWYLMVASDFPSLSAILPTAGAASRSGCRSRDRSSAFISSDSTATASAAGAIHELRDGRGSFKRAPWAGNKVNACASNDNAEACRGARVGAVGVRAGKECRRPITRG